MDIKFFIILLILLMLSIKKKNKKKYKSSKELDVIMNIENKQDKGRQFEYFTAELLQDLGFKNVQVTSKIADGGKDIIARKNGKLYYIECKCWKYNEKDWRTRVGEDVMRSVFGAAYDSGNKEKVYPMVMTTSYFSDKAIAYAKRNGIALIDRDELNRLNKKKKKN